ncbi:MAG: S16 family serine protease, partial [Anaerolineales bacterium]
LAAHHNGLKTVILPRRNAPDLDDVPAEVRKEMSFVFVDTADEVFRAALDGSDVSSSAQEASSPSQEAASPTTKKKPGRKKKQQHEESDPR